jgi:biotin carboxyl carrier protein
VVPETVSAPTPAERSQASAAESADEERLRRSPVAGIVIKANLEAGQSIQANDLIVVLEE